LRVTCFACTEIRGKQGWSTEVISQAMAARWLRNHRSGGGPRRLLGLVESGTAWRSQTESQGGSYLGLHGGHPPRNRSDPSTLTRRLDRTYRSSGAGGQHVNKTDSRPHHASAQRHRGRVPGRRSQHKIAPSCCRPGCWNRSKPSNFRDRRVGVAGG
jgi:hypothetical protein